MIRIRSLAIATPSLKMSQPEALSFILGNVEMRSATRALYQKVFANESVRERRFEAASTQEFLETEADPLNRRYEKSALRLAAQSVSRALARADAKAAAVSFLSSSTCTGYLCPGLSSRLIEACGLRRDLRSVDVVGMGCGSAVPSLEQCYNYLTAHPGAKALSVSTEICSSAIYFDNAADLVISNAIFADGSAACLLENGKAKSGAAILGFESLTYPEWRDELKFTTEEGRLRNVLGKKVPAFAGQAAKDIVRVVLKRYSLKASQISRWIFHAGGQKVLDSIQRSLDLPDPEMSFSRGTLSKYGNLSSPSVLYTLHDLLARNAPAGGEKGLIITFGAGFSIHACLIEF